MLCRRISMTSRVLLLLLTVGYGENSSEAGKFYRGEGRPQWEGEGVRHLSRGSGPE